MFFQINCIVAFLAILPFATPSPLLANKRDTTTITRTITSSSKPTTTTHAIAEREDAYTRTTVTSIVVSTTKKPTVTRTSSNTVTTTSSGVTPTKTGLKTCNVQGTANDVMTTNEWGSDRASDALDCQRKCMTVSQCISYSFQYPSSTNDDNCVFYHMFMTKGVTPSRNSGIYFSDKYPEDGSNYCYGSTPLWGYPGCGRVIVLGDWVENGDLLDGTEVIGIFWWK